jgi:hypothetical protein
MIATERDLPRRILLAVCIGMGAKNSGNVDRNRKHPNFRPCF